MGTTIALLMMLAAAPAQSGLTLTHVRSTHGLLGPERRSDSLAPGDVLFLCFDIEGITVEDGGKVQYRMGIEASDSSGKVVFRQQPADTEAMVSLGGATVPAFAQLDVGLDTPPGEYKFKVTVKDRVSGKEQSLTRPVTVRPRGFALVRETVSLDARGNYPAALLACGQGVWVHCSAVDFARDPATKQPDLIFEIRVLDERGKPTLAKPLTHKVNKDIPTEEKKVPVAFPLSLNRPGKFTIEVLATDAIGGKKAKIVAPITVLSAAKE
jgi:hypothetical protein